ncbi:MAG: CinA family protein [Nitrospirae bacterium]|nr:CinA family protein [Nitrospirota bacterium]
MDLNLAKTIHSIFKKKGLSLSVAESCTGGLICHYLTAVPGASSFLQAGVVVYSAESKTNILGIPRKIFSAHGMVSEETARLMAKKVRTLTKTDVAVSTTGNLGPGVLEDKPKGLVFVAVSSKKGTVTRKLQLKGTRGRAKEKAVLSALGFLAEVVSNG